jgi:hypothetical protein
MFYGSIIVQICNFDENFAENFYGGEWGTLLIAKVYRPL